jgi:hypothetical protein
MVAATAHRWTMRLVALDARGLGAGDEVSKD